MYIHQKNFNFSPRLKMYVPEISPRLKILTSQIKVQTTSIDTTRKTSHNLARDRGRFLWSHKVTSEKPLSVFDWSTALRKSIWH